MTINTNTVSGLFTAGNTPFASVSGNDISVSASAGKDPLFVIIFYRVAEEIDPYMINLNYM